MGRVRQTEPEIEITPAMVEDGVTFVREFFPAEWGGVRGIDEAEATSLVAGLLSAVLDPHDAQSNGR